MVGYLCHRNILPAPPMNPPPAEPRSSPDFDLEQFITKPVHGEPLVEEKEGRWEDFPRQKSEGGLSQEDIPPPPLQMLEAALFCAPRPLGSLVLARLFPGWRPTELEGLIGELNDRFRRVGRPCRAVREPTGWVLKLMAGTIPIQKAAPVSLSNEVALAPGELDVLALVAYRQPIGREELDSVRGSDSAVSIRQLLKLGLIRMETNQTGRVYSTTPGFLEALGIRSLKDLPRVEEAPG